MDLPSRSACDEQVRHDVMTVLETSWKNHVSAVSVVAPGSLQLSMHDTPAGTKGGRAQRVGYMHKAAKKKLAKRCLIGLGIAVLLGISAYCGYQHARRASSITALNSFTQAWRH